MVGTWGEWNEGDFNSCTLPCGGGKINRHRICIYPPCEGEAFEVTDRECNTQSCHEGVDSEECFHGNGFMYRGCAKVGFIQIYKISSWPGFIHDCNSTNNTVTVCGISHTSGIKFVLESK